MYQFNYKRASSVADASKAVASASDGVFLAGGMTLLPTLKQRLAKPSDVVDLQALNDLKGVKEDGGNVVIGAMTRHADVAKNDIVKKRIPALAGLAAHIGDAQVRNRGTIGGSVANNDPAADYPSACLALGATIVTSKREIKADDFFSGMFTTALEPGEMVTAVKFPVPQKAAYEKFPNPASRYAMVGVFVAQAGGAIRVAVTGAGQDGVFRHKGLEEALGKSLTKDAAMKVAVSADGLNSDIHASAEYRAHLIKVMAGRAAEKAAKG